MSTVILTVGIPASGKSTWARENAVDLNAAIVCRDDIRIMQGLKHGQDEELVTKVEHALIEGLISEGKDCIVADTNINKTFRNRLIKFCHQRGADVEIVVFDIGLDEAVLRDMVREDSVGADVIRKMHDSFKGQQIKSEFLPVQSFAKYESPSRFSSHLRSAIIVDIDGTVARHWNRSPYDYSKVADDKAIEDVVEVVTALSADYVVVFVSGRDDSCENDTRDWLEYHMGLGDAPLFMRKSGDQRPDWIVKNEIYDEFVIQNFRIVMVFDDRDQVVHHLRRRGITVAQVAPGRF